MAVVVVVMVVVVVAPLAEQYVSRLSLREPPNIRLYLLSQATHRPKLLFGYATWPSGRSHFQSLCVAYFVYGFREYLRLLYPSEILTRLPNCKNTCAAKGLLVIQETSYLVSPAAPFAGRIEH
uniref:Secreted protein n=1 Tax=Vespula pensylvanica TaxID=30213 RepID=A0A834KUG6_VESPE|nr:hypothetical protein H0235_013024 [Vespula pensylvanica]